MLKSFIFDLPVDKDVIFTDHKGNYKKKIEKQQRDLIIKLPFIKPFLEPDEDILLITTGYSRMNTPDQILTAWLFIYLKRSLFVFTNKRIFHIPSTVNYGYRDSISQILFSENQSVCLRGSTLVVRCSACGDQEKFIGIRGKERKKIQVILNKVTRNEAEFQERYIPGLERAHLCPHCTRALTRGFYACPNCKLTFKRKSKLRSLVPGFCYFYVRQRFLGFINITMELIIIGCLISFYLKFSQGAESTILPLMLFAGVYVFQKIAVMYHANHFIDEFIPEIENVKPLSSL